MLILFLVAAACLVAVLVVWIRHALTLRKHIGMTRAEFIKYFRRLGVSSPGPGAVYDSFQHLGVWKGFQPTPTDRIVETYKLVADDDIQEVVEKVLAAIGCEMSSSVTLKQWTAPVETLENLVQWVDWVWRIETGGRET